MYFDEDGHLAHEFYIEIPAVSKSRKAGMKRVHHNLTPQVSEGWSSNSLLSHKKALNRKASLVDTTGILK